MELKKIERIDSKFLEKIYVESEFIDSVKEIIERIKNKKNDSNSIPFVVLNGDEIVSFFTIESSHPSIDAIKEINDVYWIESFFITKNYLGKGYSMPVLNKIIQSLPLYFPNVSSLKLTVNLRNEVAQYIYKKCGFKNTGEKYSGGPVGPQYIYKYEMK